MSAVSEAVFEAVKALHPEVTCEPEGKCRGCGECCSQFLPMSPMERLRIEGYVRLHGIVPRFQPILCPFLNERRECDVYEVRPAICRGYDCRKHKSGELLVDRELLQAMAYAKDVDMAEAFCDPALVRDFEESVMKGAFR